MNKKLSIYLPLLLSGILIFGILIGREIAVNSVSKSPGGFFIYPKTDKFNNVLKYIEEEYVDTVLPNKLTEDAIINVLKDLDPHSVYIPANELQQVNEPLEGNFSGIGVQFNMQNDTVVIINAISNGPSALIGIMPGDRIIKVNDTLVAGVKLSSEVIVKKLKGPKGSKVKVTIKRPGNKKELVYEIIRNKIPLYSIDVSYMINKTTAYIKISQFSRTTNDEFLKAIEKLRPQGLKNIILDLRDNGGGYLDAAIDIANQFLSEGKLIVYTKGRTKPRENFYATAQGLCQHDSVIVLIDEFSASASEILTGAIQDNDRGIIVGRRSFGKGLVQEQTTFSDGSALRLTVARYYTPSGRCIQKPYARGIEDYYKDINYRYLHGEFESKDSIHFNDTLKFKTPGGKVVYGGGGIMPDVFVPLDTIGFTNYYAEIRDQGLMYRFAFEYSDRNRHKLNNFKDYKDLLAYLNKQKLLDEFVTYASKKGIKQNKKDIEISKNIIVIQLKGYIIRNFFNNEGYFPAMENIDNTLQKALSLLSDRG
jgi:carboxyl-terminal processing protease